MRSTAVVFLPEAADEYESARRWYALRSQAAGEGFERAVERALAFIIESPRRWPTRLGSARGMLIRGFPFYEGVQSRGFVERSIGPLEEFVGKVERL